MWCDPEQHNTMSYSLIIPDPLIMNGIVLPVTAVQRAAMPALSPDLQGLERINTVLGGLPPAQQTAAYAKAGGTLCCPQEGLFGVFTF